MSLGPNTIRKVSRFRAHSDFTTRPRTGTTSVSKPAAGSITNLLFIDASPLPTVCGDATGATAGGAMARPPAEITLDGDVEREESSPGNRSVELQPFAFTTATSVEDRGRQHSGR